MKRIVSILVIGLLVISGLGAVALPEADHIQIKKIETVSLSKPSLEDKEDYVSVHIQENNNYVTDPGRPMVPMFVKVVDLPFGSKNINVLCTIKEIHEQVIPKDIIPSSEPIPLTSISKISKEISVDETVYSSRELYPNEWYSFRVGCGLNYEDEHVTHVAIQVYPVRYSPAADKIYYLESVDITVTYDAPTTPASFNDAYDMVIIAPKKFSGILKRLVDHKNEYELPTVLKTVEAIYDEYTGIDKPEQIKYF
ncbi:MAG: peptidase C25, partial [Thermoplasmatales archaeon]|nr:peptidase C25 [Thermoplasmatales archaeon]